MARRRKKIRIYLKTFDHRILDQSAKEIVEAAKRTGATIAGPIPMPTKISRFTVLKSRFVHKDSREQFEIRTHKRLIDIIVTSQTADIFDRIDISAGVEIVVKTFNL